MPAAFSIVEFANRLYVCSRNGTPVILPLNVTDAQMFCGMLAVSAGERSLVRSAR